ncbi:hypothetical protein FALBO_9078 [Fusarium albosuccineum]|uniref:Fungal N-terminal domain-containing protein n=1 Tax=Fusarium albosuccineum TaxID=1237068 RepID=A0A8H4PAY7_9HYPO|nr:hypothetical protein FALBO_9078 [Fusarium albosuccineum]
MAEAFAALSIAANIAQFTEYAVAVISDCREIYGSVDGTKQENLELETIIQSIQDRHAGMMAACHRNNGQATSKRIMQLVAACEPCINGLIGTLNNIKTTDKSSLGSLRAAIVEFRYRNTLDGLKKRLLDIEDEVSREMIKIISNNQSDAMVSLRHLQEISEKGHHYTNNRLGRMQDELIRSAAELSRTQLDSSERAFANVVAKVEELLGEAKEVERDQRFLNSLDFEDLKEREDRVKNAKETTLK